MPIYEFRCKRCKKRFTVLTLRVSEKVAPVCDKCGYTQADRLLSRFAMPKSEEARLDALSDPSNLGDLDESDPKSAARWMRRMAKEMGEDLSGEDMDQMMDEIESDSGSDGGGDDAE